MKVDSRGESCIGTVFVALTVAIGLVLLVPSSAQGQKWNADGSGNLYYDSGMVGVGTTSPQYLMDVDGVLHAKRVWVKRSDTEYADVIITSPDNSSVKLQTEKSDRRWWMTGFGDGHFALRTHTGSYNLVSALYVDENLNVGIGTESPSNRLAVNGSIRAREVLVEDTNWPDFVFEVGYDLPTIEEVARHVEANGHLPGVPSKDDVAAEGVALGEMDATLLRKIEELTLYAIERNEEVAALEKTVEQQQEKLQQQSKQLSQQQQRIEALHQQVQRLAEQVRDE